MFNVKSFRRTKISNALLVSFALSVAGIPVAMANDTKDNNNADNTATSADNRNVNTTNSKTTTPADASARDNKTTTYEESQSPVSDSWITTKVKTQLLANDEIKGMDINVSTTNGVVTLAGVLDSQAQVDAAIAVAKGVEGVKNVDTRALKVKPEM